MFTLVVSVLLFSSACSALKIDDAIFEQLVETVSILENRVAQQDAAISAQQVEIDELKTGNSLMKELADREQKRFLVDEGPIAFSAKIVPRYVSHLHSNDGLIFETVLTNYGGGYHNDSGIFTVPLGGIYLFTSSILDHMSNTLVGSVKVHAEIVRNNSTLARVFAHAEDNYRDQGAQTIIVKVDAGDQIWVRIVDNNDLGLGGEHYTTFSGYMLWQM